MIFLVIKLGSKKEIVFELIVFFYQRNEKNKSASTIYPWGLNVKYLLLWVFTVSTISCFLMAKSNETKKSFLFHIAMKESEKKCSFAVDSVSLVYLDRGEGPQHLSFLILSKGKNRSFDLLKGVFFAL